MKTSVGFFYFALYMCNTYASDLVSKIFHSSRGISTADDNQVMANVLLQVGQLNEKVDQMSQTVSQLTQTDDQLSRAENQQNSRKDICEHGWISFGDSCYYFSLKEEFLSWPDALVECRSKGAYLAEISDQQENKFLETQAQFLGSAASSGVSVIDCRDSFLTGDNAIPDSALTASGSYNSNHTPVHGRLDAQADFGKAGFWVAASSTDMTQWIQADLGQPVKVTGVVTQSRQGTTNQYMHGFVYYSSDCSHWSPVKRTDGSEMTFYLRRPDTKRTQILPEPVTARCVRINPRYWKQPDFPEIRFDIIGCPLKTEDLSLWLGGTDILQEHEFLWATSGTRISYDTFRDWHPRQPDNARDSEHCLMMNSLSGWHDAACSELKRYVCEKDKK